MKELHFKILNNLHIHDDPTAQEFLLRIIIDFLLRSSSSLLRNEVVAFQYHS